MSSNTPPRHRIVIDCDPGRDDALAIAMALASPEEIDLAGITVVAGNAPLDIALRNARFVCGLCGFPDVPIHAGAGRPLVREPMTGERTHGESGLEGLEVEMRPTPVRERNAVEFLAQTLRSAADGEVTLVATGPLTNLASLMTEYPGLVLKARRIVLMGGASRDGGNVAPAAEFNVLADPHAAARVFEFGRPITVFNLDATHQVLAGPEHVERLERTGGGPAGRLAPLLPPPPDDERFAARFGPGRMPIHDPCTIAWLLEPGLFKGVEAAVAVETEGTHALGATVVDWWGVTGEAPNAEWIVEADGEGVLDLLIERIGRL